MDLNKRPTLAGIVTWLCSVFLCASNCIQPYLKKSKNEKHNCPAMKLLFVCGAVCCAYTRALCTSTFYVLVRLLSSETKNQHLASSKNTNTNCTERAMNLKSIFLCFFLSFVCSLAFSIALLTPPCIRYIHNCNRINDVILSSMYNVIALLWENMHNSWSQNEHVRVRTYTYIDVETSINENNCFLFTIKLFFDMQFKLCEWSMETKTNRKQIDSSRKMGESYGLGWKNDVDWKGNNFCLNFIIL